MREGATATLVLATLLALAGRATTAPAEPESLSYDNLTATSHGEWLLLLLAPRCLASKHLMAEYDTLRSGLRAQRPHLRIARLDAAASRDRAVRFMFDVVSYPAAVHAQNGVYRAYRGTDEQQSNVTSAALLEWLRVPASSASKHEELLPDPFAQEHARKVRWLHALSLLADEGQHFVTIFSVKPLLFFAVFALAIAVAFLVHLLCCSCCCARQQAQRAVRFAEKQKQKQHEREQAVLRTQSEQDADTDSDTDDSEFDFVEYREVRSKSQCSRTRSRSKSKGKGRRSMSYFAKRPTKTLH